MWDGTGTKAIAIPKRSRNCAYCKLEPPGPFSGSRPAVNRLGHPDRGGSLAGSGTRRGLLTPPPHLVIGRRGR